MTAQERAAILAALEQRVQKRIRTHMRDGQTIYAARLRVGFYRDRWFEDARRDFVEFFVRRDEYYSPTPIHPVRSAVLFVLFVVGTFAATGYAERLGLPAFVILGFVAFWSKQNDIDKCNDRRRLEAEAETARDAERDAQNAADRAADEARVAALQAARATAAPAKPSPDKPLALGILGRVMFKEGLTSGDVPLMTYGSKLIRKYPTKRADDSNSTNGDRTS